MPYVVRDEQGAVVQYSLTEPSAIETEWLDDDHPAVVAFFFPPPALADYQRAVEAHVDAVAAERGYSSAASCASYIAPDPSDPTLSDIDRAWDAEARVFFRWRNAAWAHVFAALAAWQGGGETPTIEDLIAGLPEIEWPA